MKTKVTYILSNIDKAIAFEWIVQKIDKKEIELSFILLNNKPTYIESFLKENNIYTKLIYLNSKKDYPKAFVQVIKEFTKIKPDIVHAHLRDANILGLSAAKLLGIRKRIYTRHHSTFHHDNFPKAVKWDKLVNYLASNIVAISENSRTNDIGLASIDLNSPEIILMHPLILCE